MSRRVRKRYFRLDLENPSDPLLRVSRDQLAAELRGDGAGPVKWNKNKLNLHHIAAEWEDLGYQLLFKMSGKWYKVTDNNFEEFADSPEAVRAAAFVFSDDDGTTWRAVHSTKVYTNRADAVVQELIYLTGSEK